VGDLVSFYAKTVKVGKTSITVHVIVEAERFGSMGQKVKVTEAEVTYVAISQNREKVIIGK
jgi:acyl-CoA thioesterase YciA